MAALLKKLIDPIGAAAIGVSLIALLCVEPAAAETLTPKPTPCDQAYNSVDRRLGACAACVKSCAEERQNCRTEASKWQLIQFPSPSIEPHTFVEAASGSRTFEFRPIQPSVSPYDRRNSGLDDPEARRREKIEKCTEASQRCQRLCLSDAQSQ